MGVKPLYFQLWDKEFIQVPPIHRIPCLEYPIILVWCRRWVFVFVWQICCVFFVIFPWKFELIWAVNYDVSVGSRHPFSRDPLCHSFPWERICTSSLVHSIANKHSVFEVGKWADGQTERMRDEQTTSLSSIRQHSPGAPRKLNGRCMSFSNYRIGYWPSSKNRCPVRSVAWVHTGRALCLPSFQRAQRPLY